MWINLLIWTLTVIQLQKLWFVCLLCVQHHEWTQGAVEKQHGGRDSGDFINIFFLSLSFKRNADWTENYTSVSSSSTCVTASHPKRWMNTTTVIWLEWKLIVPFPTGVKSQMLADVSGSFVWCEEDNIELLWIVKASRCHCVRCVWSPEPSNLHQHIHKGTTADSLTLLPAPSFSPRICGSLHFAQ